jgi:hypothetical protein
MAEDKKKKQEPEIFQAYFQPPTGVPGFLKSLDNKQDALAKLRERQEKMQRIFFDHPASNMDNAFDLALKTTEKQQESEGKSDILAKEREKKHEEERKQNEDAFQQQACMLSEQKKARKHTLDFSDISSAFQRESQNILEKARDIEFRMDKTKKRMEFFEDFFID